MNVGEDWTDSAIIAVLSSIAPNSQKVFYLRKAWEGAADFEASAQGIRQAAGNHAYGFRQAIPSRIFVAELMSDQIAVAIRF